MGFGLDLDRCAVTGVTADLAYVSPKSGRAVCETAGEPYKLRLLPLPPFLRAGATVEDPPAADIMNGFRLTGYFLMRDLYGPCGQTLPEPRGAYLAEIEKRFSQAARRAT